MPIARDEWLGYAARLIAQDVNNRAATYPHRTPILRSSFPERQGRSVRLYGFAEASDGVNILISPYISSPEEMYLTALYATIKWGSGEWRGAKAYGEPRRRTRDRLEWCGFQAPYSRIVPTASLMRHVQTQVTELCRDYGTPEAAVVDPVASRATRQTTRMIRLACDGPGNGDYPHDAYIIRASRTQIMRGIPFCPVCWDEGYTTILREE